jgi:carboxylesterase type B
MQVLAIDQVTEVSDSLTWTMDNIAQYGGDPSRVFLMGHSSGKFHDTELIERLNHYL